MPARYFVGNWSGAIVDNQFRLICIQQLLFRSLPHLLDRTLSYLDTVSVPTSSHDSFVCYYTSLFVYFFFHLVHVIFRIIIIKLFRCSRISHERSKKENNLHHVFFTHRAHFFLTLNTFFSYYLFVRPFRFLHTKRKGRKRESFCVAFFPLVRRKKIIAKSIITCFSLGMYSITSDDSSIQPTFVTRFYKKGTLRVVRKSFCHYFHIFFWYVKNSSKIIQFECQLSIFTTEMNVFSHGFFGRSASVNAWKKRFMQKWAKRSQIM